MTRAPLLLFCCLAWLSMPAQARLPDPEAWHDATALRDLAEIRKNGELRVLVNQSRNSSGEVKGQAIGVEYHRLRAFEQYLNRNAQNGRNLRLKIIPRSKEQLLAALEKGEGDLVAPGELFEISAGQAISASAATHRDVSILVVGNRGNRHYRKIEDMAGAA